MPGLEAAALRRLVAEVRADRDALASRVRETGAFRAAPRTPERIAALALALDRGYTTLESILERVAVTLEGGVAEVRDWHASLLRGAALDIEGVRPKLLRAEVVAAVERLRRFRHFLRHAYAASLDDDQVGAVADAWLRVVPWLGQDLDSFERFVLALAERLAGAG